MTARRDGDRTHWPEVTWTCATIATLTCTCGAVETEPVALSHPLAYEAAASRLVFRHGSEEVIPFGEDDDEIELFSLK